MARATASPPTSPSLPFTASRRAAAVRPPKIRHTRARAAARQVAQIIGEFTLDDWLNGASFLAILGTAFLVLAVA